MEILTNDTNELTESLMEDFIGAAEACVRLEREDTGLTVLDPAIAEISLSFVSMDEIHELNRTYRGIDRHSKEREIVYLFTHSVLHLLGYDHMDEESKKVMRAREEQVMAERQLV